MFYLHLCPCPPYMPHPPLRPDLGIRSPGRAISDGCGRPCRCRKSVPGLLSGNALIYRAISPALAARIIFSSFWFPNSCQKSGKAPGGRGWASYVQSCPHPAPPRAPCKCSCCFEFSTRDRVCWHTLARARLTSHTPPCHHLPLPPENRDSCLLKPWENRGVQPSPTPLLRLPAKTLLCQWTGHGQLLC